MPVSSTVLNENFNRSVDSGFIDITTGLRAGHQSMSDQQDDDIIRSLTWTTDGQKLISGSYRLIRIFDTATWQQSAILAGHTNFVYAISLCQSNRLLASVSQDKTARLWNLDTNLRVGSPLQHEHNLHSSSLSLDGKVLVTGCENTNAYAWDVHAILKEAGLEDLLSIGIKLAPKDGLEQKASQDDSGVQNTPRSSLDDKSFLEADATRCADQFGDVDELPPTFFAGMEAEVDSSPMGGAHPHSSVNALFARLSSLLHRFRPQNSEANEILQTSRPLTFRPRAFLARLSSLLHRFRSEADAPDELQQPSTPSRSDPHVLVAHRSSFWPRPQLRTDEEAKPHPTTPFSSRPDALISWLSSFFRSQPRIEDELELSQGTMHSHAVEVPAMRDREVLFVAEPLRPNRIPTQPRDTTIPGTRPAHSLPLRMLAHLVLFLCCASPQRVGGDVHPAQQQEGQAQAHATSSQAQHQQGQLYDQSQTQPVALSMSATPTALDAHTTAPDAASGQPLSLPLRTRLVLFLCCASLPHAERQ